MSLKNLCTIKYSCFCPQDIEDIPNELKLLYKTAWEMPQKTIFDMAACRGPFIDQSQCLNVHMIDPLEKLTSMHFYAWETVNIKYYIHILFFNCILMLNILCIFIYRV